MLPTFYTKRLIIRPLNVKDAPDMYEYATDFRVGPNAGWAPHVDIDETKQIIKTMSCFKTKFGVGTFAVELKSESKMIGTIELYNFIPEYKAELGYSLNPEYWNNGYITEAAIKLLEYGFIKLGLKRIEASSFTDNIASQRVCEKIGMRFEGLSKKAYYRYDGKILDIYRFGITDDEFFEHLKEVENEENR